MRAGAADCASCCWTRGAHPTASGPNRIGVSSAHEQCTACAVPGWEAYLKHCRKGLTGVPMTAVIDIKELKPESLHAVIKTAALLSDLGEAIGYTMEPKVELQQLLERKHGWYKPPTGKRHLRPSDLPHIAFCTG